MTIAEEHEMSDFQLKFGGETPDGWPPKFLERQQGRAIQ